ncbi:MULTISPECIES: hypothetical protein [unclassified Rhizobium]|uniref:hypothetical protein n=1 Tax=unclassified Rhizobium TaxID=2613769 RepID=UPI001ADD5957|nr:MULTISPECIES: hypothetical protein [unclassified Rhizobium]MBO9100837.1 hypothetical protein [Rhizobium sp. L58/93]MBO9170465.1 hypothetical protein [Rhizobium sp. L245/93]MBO9186390.1 hypothetical protein [Rhizobium sp. E27B/91]QXZ86289.1 hypothetical protein J5287_24845 [Rhizobium sp. K1/93]QXZ92256.1 hypothetical protein J5280_24340 [Rhizobium sp. K15/93]
MAEYRGLHLLKGDGRTTEVKLLKEWLRRVPSIRRKFMKWADDFDPFAYNEAASVAVLSNAASKAGYLAHTEYVAMKRHSTQGRPFRNGRCDLWVADAYSELSWAFEFKQHFAYGNIRQGTFDNWLERAKKDARALDYFEADYRVGCLILCPRRDLAIDDDLIARFDTLCTVADIAFRIGSGDTAIWLAFKHAFGN